MTGHEGKMDIFQPLGQGIRIGALVVGYVRVRIRAQSATLNYFIVHFGPAEINKMGSKASY